MPDRTESMLLPRDGRPTVVTVGTFDGVHRGHWQVLRQLCARAAELGGRSVLVTFDPHPLRIVRPAAAPPLLTTPIEKTEILAESGVNYAVFLRFTPELAQYPPERFVDEVLVGRLGMTHLVIGYDHGFGKGRSGDPERLREIGAERGFDVQVVPAVELGTEPISSSRVRRAVEAGDMAAAARALGRAYAVRGVVVRGDGRGRQLGFPTANIQVPTPDKLLPREGIYAVRAWLRARGGRSGSVLDGVLHLGPRPTFQGAPPTVELHLFDFEGDLYGEPVRVDFCARLRDIHKYTTVRELIEAISGDAAAARALLSRPATACQPGAEWLD